MAGKYICFWLLIKSHHRHNQTLQLSCADGSDDEEDKEYLIEVEAMKMDISDSSGDVNDERLDLVHI